MRVGEFMVGTRKNDKPIGREQVVAAMLEHAADLFAERGPAATSTRDIAARAGINQALIFRHFGNKEQLVGAVLDDLAAKAAAARHAAGVDTTEPGITDAIAGVLLPGDPVDTAVTRTADRRHWQVLARALLDGYPVGRLQHQFPGMSELIDATRARLEDDTQARLAAANVVALVLGWHMFGPFLHSAAAMDEIPEPLIRHAIAAAATNVLDTAARTGIGESG
ncbi:TetR/AcrR family transcriptional regulator [Nocardia sp. CNY236]|uniref:TetR/AcrR family transcriptional regulator n=1 Tax=Nocardia sp. CNY236 TaxID=1169152 RepID=UPI0004065E6F|nr:TetR/AcrR family transcriptional regulator [Nocardia sp. CNY236]